MIKYTFELHNDEIICHKCYTKDCAVKLNLIESNPHIHCLKYTSEPKVSLTIEEIKYMRDLLNMIMKTNNSWWLQNETHKFKKEKEKENKLIQGIIDKLKQ